METCKEEAAEAFAKAANYYRLAADYQSSCNCYVRCASILPAFDAARYYQDAANVIKSISTYQAIEYFTKAAEILAGLARMSGAAKLRK